MDTTEKKNSIQANSEALEVVRFTVYGEPVAKARARTVTNIDKNGKRRTHSYTPEKTAAHEQTIALVYKSVYHGFQFQPNVPLSFSVDVYLPIPNRTPKYKRDAMIAGEIRPIGHVGDTDNFAKCASDALLKKAYDDDCQIVEMTCRKFYSDTPRTEIVIAKVGNSGG